MSAARFFLFGARDVWFVVGLPLYLNTVLGWSYTGVGTFFALWVIGYGLVQGLAPNFLKRLKSLRTSNQVEVESVADGATSRQWVLFLLFVMVLIAMIVPFGWQIEWVLIIGLGLFGLVFAVNSSIHSFLILAYTDSDNVALNVGFYYMANAGGRLLGTLASGLLYMQFGLIGCLWGGVLFFALTWLISSCSTTCSTTCVQPFTN